jgi:hypothetical protein
MAAVRIKRNNCGGVRSLFVGNLFRRARQPLLMASTSRLENAKQYMARTG